jgi:hypothetical protein
LKTDASRREFRKRSERAWRTAPLQRDDIGIRRCGRSRREFVRRPQNGGIGGEPGRRVHSDDHLHGGDAGAENHDCLVGGQSAILRQDAAGEALTQR